MEPNFDWWGHNGSYNFTRGDRTWADGWCFLVTGPLKKWKTCFFVNWKKKLCLCNTMVFSSLLKWLLWHFFKFSSTWVVTVAMVIYYGGYVYNIQEALTAIRCWTEPCDKHQSLNSVPPKLSSILCKPPLGAWYYLLLVELVLDLF